jgi:hypothetical protein
MPTPRSRRRPLRPPAPLDAYAERATQSRGEQNSSTVPLALFNGSYEAKWKDNLRSWHLNWMENLRFSFRSTLRQSIWCIQIWLSKQNEFCSFMWENEKCWRLLPSILFPQRTKERIKILPALLASLQQCQFGMATCSNSHSEIVSHAGRSKMKATKSEKKPNECNCYQRLPLHNSELGWPPAAL